MLDVVMPVVAGAIIGYVTNRIAIKMLFWPHEAHFIFGLRVPFTPGLFVRRRRDFSASLSQLLEERFVTPDQMYEFIMRMEKSGVIDEFLNEMGPVFRFAYRAYWAKTPDAVFREDCKAIILGLNKRHVVGDTVVKALDLMSTEEIEDMIMTVVHRELRGITWCGAVLGALIGLLQVWI